MLNLFFGFSGRLSRRQFLLWSLIVPLTLIVPPAIGIASQAASPDTNLAQDLVASGMVWPFFLLYALSSYISVALFWKRIQDADEARFGGWNSTIMRWGYAILTLLNGLLVGLNLIALGKIEGSAAGLVVMGFWSMACWARPHNGANSSGPDPRNGSAATGLEDLSQASLQLDAAMDRALSQRTVESAAVLSPKLMRPTKTEAPVLSSKPSFGRRGHA
jgi:uncharacterized membrane protein YhaH (DUF805 family)